MNTKKCLGENNVNNARVVHGEAVHMTHNADIYNVERDKAYNDWRGIQDLKELYAHGILRHKHLEEVHIRFNKNRKNIAFTISKEHYETLLDQCNDIKTFDKFDSCLNYIMFNFYDLHELDEFLTLFKSICPEVANIEKILTNYLHNYYIINGN